MAAHEAERLEARIDRAERALEDAHDLIRILLDLLEATNMERNPE